MTQDEAAGDDRLARLPGIAVRAERPGDVAAIATLHRAAFGSEVESGIVERYRLDERWDPLLSLVAVDAGGRIVGHALVSVGRLEVDGAIDGRVVVLALGPIAVVPDLQRRGIGGALMRAAIAAADARGAAALFLLGHPTYYPRFGFVPARLLGLEPPEPWSDAAWMARPLSAWRRDVHGTLHFPDAFAGV